MPGELMGPDKLCWEDVSVTTRIPELTVCPDRAQIFMFSAVTWNRHHIHYSKDAAVSEGLPEGSSGLCTSIHTIPERSSSAPRDADCTGAS